MTTDLVSAALHAKRLGWGVTPLVDKRAVLKDWPDRDLTERGVVYWMTREFVMGYGLILRGVLVIDVDGDSHEMHRWIERHGLSRPSMAVGASKGEHWYFLSEGVEETRSRLRHLGLPVDLKMTGHMVGPGSYVRDTDHYYTLIGHLLQPGQLDVPPPSLVMELNRQPAVLQPVGRPNVNPRKSNDNRNVNRQVRDPRAYCLRIESHQGAHGSAGLVRCIAVLRDCGWSPHDILHFLVSEWNTPPRVTPPWSEVEILHAVNRHCGV